LCAVFPHAARKNRTQKDEEYLAAAGEKCGIATWTSQLRKSYQIRDILP
jgi:hypothetical protein